MMADGKRPDEELTVVERGIIALGGVIEDLVERHPGAELEPQLRDLLSRVKRLGQATFCYGHGVPHFARVTPCSQCGRGWYDSSPEARVSVRQATTSHLTSCPFCPASWTD